MFLSGVEPRCALFLDDGGFGDGASSVRFSSGGCGSAGLKWTLWGILG